MAGKRNAELGSRVKILESRLEEFTHRLESMKMRVILLTAEVKLARLLLSTDEAPEKEPMVTVTLRESDAALIREWQRRKSGRRA